MRLTMLGTGNALVTEVYNTCFVIENENQYLLIDGGGGSEILKRLKDAKISIADIHHIFVTHKHIDHILGIVWMTRIICQNMQKGAYEGDAYIYGHEEVISLIQELSEKLLQKKQTDFIGKRVHLVVVTDGEEKEIIGKKVTFFDIHSTKAKQFGFCMELEEGQKLTCCGDEPYCDWEEKYAKGSKWLLHEAFCLYGQRETFHPYEKNHSTVKDACELAEKLGVENLILYHTEDKNIKERKVLYTEEGKAYYRGNLYVPDDMEAFEL